MGYIAPIPQSDAQSWGFSHSLPCGQASCGLSRTQSNRGARNNEIAEQETQSLAMELGCLEYSPGDFAQVHMLWLRVNRRVEQHKVNLWINEVSGLDPSLTPCVALVTPNLHTSTHHPCAPTALLSDWSTPFGATCRHRRRRR